VHAGESSDDEGHRMNGEEGVPPKLAGRPHKQEPASETEDCRFIQRRGGRRRGGIGYVWQDVRIYGR
jgi:hypothetical protein